MGDAWPALERLEKFLRSLGAHVSAREAAAGATEPTRLEALIEHTLLPDLDEIRRVATATLMPDDRAVALAREEIPLRVLDAIEGMETLAPGQRPRLLAAVVKGCARAIVRSLEEPAAEVPRG